jgi:hypothetical protein
MLCDDLADKRPPQIIQDARTTATGSISSGQQRNPQDVALPPVV